MNRTFFHITPISNKESILERGILANSESQIFVSDNFNHLKRIALCQLGIYEYSIFEISEANLTGAVVKDKVGEIGSDHLFIVYQNHISSQNISYLKDEIWDFFDLLEEIERENARLFGKSEIQFIETFVVLDHNWCEHYNKKYNKNIKCEI